MREVGDWEDCILRGYMILMITRYYKTYQQVVLPLFPFLMDEVGFEEQLLCWTEKIGTIGLEAALAAAAFEGNF